MRQRHLQLAADATTNASFAAEVEAKIRCKCAKSDAQLRKLMATAGVERASLSRAPIIILTLCGLSGSLPV